MKYSFSCHKSPYDERDWLLRSFLKDEVLPIRGGVPKDEMTPVRSQGAEGACVSYALVAGIMEYLNNVLDYPKHKDLIRLSTRFLYEESKRLSEHSFGTTLKAGVTIGKNLGTCLERYWPYIANDVGSPHPLAYGNALKFRLKSFARILNIDDLKRALNNPKVKLVLAGVDVFKGMINTKTGIIPDPSCFDRKKGGHAICINYYDDTYSYWKNPGGVQFKNSWIPWGQDGYGFLSYTYLRKHMLDAFAVIDIDDPEDYKIETVGVLSKEECLKLWI